LQINLSGIKRNRQNEKRRVHNKSFKTEVKSIARKIREAVDAKKKEDAEKSYSELVKLVDSAVTKGLFKRNTAARKKSRMYHLISKIASA
jgi:small subunit ribosomal protein S20